jgi:hypothetical protein
MPSIVVLINSTSPEAEEQPWPFPKMAIGWCSWVKGH